MYCLYLQTLYPFTKEECNTQSRGIEVHMVSHLLIGKAGKSSYVSNLNSKHSTWEIALPQ